MFITMELLTALYSGETNISNIAPDDRQAIRYVIGQEIFRGTKEKDDDFNAKFITQNGRGDFVAIYSSKLLKDMPLASYSVPFKCGLLNYIVFPEDYHYEEYNMRVCSYLYGFFTELIRNNEKVTHPIVGELIALRFLSNRASEYVNNTFLFKTAKDLLSYNIDPTEAKVYLSCDLPDDLVYDLRFTMLDSLPKRKFPVTIHGINFISNEEHSSFECEGTFENLLAECMHSIQIYNNPARDLMKVVSKVFKMYDTTCTLLFVSYDADVMDPGVAELIDTSIQASLIDEGNKKYLILQVHPTRTNTPKFEDKIEITGNNKLDAYHLLNLNVSVKDWFDAEHKNGIPTTKEEYQKFPMGNPQPMEIPAIISNAFVE